jgi:hypothetical protein
MQEIEKLIDELDERMQKDCRWLARWRQFHRIVAVFLSLVLTVAPSVLAVGLMSSESLLGKVLLLMIAVVGGLTTTFKPYTQSYKRRADLNALHRLRDEFRAEVAKAQEDGTPVVDIYKKYSSVYANIYELRGKELIEATLSVTEQREMAGRSADDSRDVP